MEQTALLDSNNSMFSKRDLHRLIVPLIVEQFLTRTVGMLDIAMVSSVSKSAVSGVSLVDPINTLIITLFAALAAGGAIVAAQYLGSGNRKNSSIAGQQLIIITAMISLVIGVLSVLFNKQILNLLFSKVEPEVMRNARDYFLVTAYSFPFIAVYNAAAALFRCMGNSRISMVTAFVMNIINVVGNAFFIYKMNLGAFGAGLSTTISRVIAAVILLIVLRNPDLPIVVNSFRLKYLNFSMIKRILKIGIPNGLENSIFQIGKIIVTSLIATLSTDAIAAHGVASTLLSIPIGPGAALGLAMTTVVAQCVGARKYDEADRYMKLLMKYSSIFLFILNTLIVITLRPILGFFNLTGESFNIAFQLMIFSSVATVIFWSASFTLPNGLRAAGDVNFTMVVAVFSMIIFRVGLSYIFVLGFNIGVISVWIAMCVDWIFRSIFFMWRWKSGKWKYRVVT